MVYIRKYHLNSYLLVAPLIFFLAVFFIAPIASIVQKAVHTPEVAAGFPELAAYLKECSEPVSMCEHRHNALMADLTNRENRAALAVAARRLNYAMSGFRSLVLDTARTLRRTEHAQEAPSQQLLTSIDERWADDAYWSSLEKSLRPYSPNMLLASLDLRIAENNQLQSVPSDQRIYLNIIKRTVLIAGSVTLVVIVLGYAFAAATQLVKSRMLRVLCLFAIMVPFWTSLLVRTSSWIVILQKEGILNSLLLSSNIISAPMELIFNRFGVFVVMVHVLLPFAMLPIYSVMNGVSPTYLKAAASLGANPIQQFFKVYLPLTMPGVVAGGTITFIVALGYYITPALVGGPSDQMLGYYIAYYTNVELNIGMSAALALILLLSVLVLLAVFVRLIGVRGMMAAVK